MKKLLAVALSLLTFSSLAEMGQKFTASSTGPQAGAKTSSKRGPIFRATKEQIKQAQAILKARGFYAGEATAKLDDATRDGLREYQKAEGLKVTGTMNKLTLEKMGIVLTDKQKAM
ncbi:MAG: peptidoglycan-binding domain-containing protein [Pyrinomonadaceae bacterium]